MTTAQLGLQLKEAIRGQVGNMAEEIGRIASIDHLKVDVLEWPGSPFVEQKPYVTFCYRSHG